MKLWLLVPALSGQRLGLTCQETRPASWGGKESFQVDLPGAGKNKHPLVAAGQAWPAEDEPAATLGRKLMTCLKPRWRVQQGPIIPLGKAPTWELVLGWPKSRPLYWTPKCYCNPILL